MGVCTHGTASHKHCYQCAHERALKSIFKMQRQRDRAEAQLDAVTRERDVLATALAALIKVCEERHGQKWDIHKLPICEALSAARDAADKTRLNWKGGGE